MRGVKVGSVLVLALAGFLCSGEPVFAKCDTASGWTPGKPCRDADQVGIRVSGEDKSLQEAYDEGLLSGGGTLLPKFLTADETALLPNEVAPTAVSQVPIATSLSDAAWGLIGPNSMADNACTEAKLDAVDTPADEECVTWEASSGRFEYQACGGAGSDPTLAGDVTGLGSGNDLDEAAVRDELEAVLRLSFLQGGVTDEQVPDSIRITDAVALDTDDDGVPEISELSDVLRFDANGDGIVDFNLTASTGSSSFTGKVSTLKIFGIGGGGSGAGTECLARDPAAARTFFDLNCNGDTTTTPEAGEGYPAYGDTAGAALTGDTATGFFTSGTIDDARISGSDESDEVAAGTNGQVQFNSGGTALAGDAGLTFDPATDTLSAGTFVSSCADGSCIYHDRDQTVAPAAPPSGRVGLYAFLGRWLMKIPGDAAGKLRHLLAANSTMDTNGDGRPDYVYVWGDYNGDGLIDTNDIREAIDALRVSTDEASTKPALTVRTGTGNCGTGVDQCVIRSLGNWINDGFVSEMWVWVSGFQFYTTGRAVLGAAVNTACTATGGGAAGPDCFTRPTAGSGSGSFVTDEFAVGMVLWAYYFPEVWNGGSPHGKRLVVAAVTAGELEVNCDGIPAGTTGCLQTEPNRPGRWIVSPGVNGLYQVDASDAITATVLPLATAPPKEETTTPTVQAAPSGSVNSTVVVDATPMVVELGPGTWGPPASAPANSASALIELPSFTTLRGAGRNATKIVGNSDSVLRSVISGPRVQFYPGTVMDVEVTDLEIDGGWDVGAANVYAIGLDMGGFMNSTASRLRIHDTGHACIHLFNASFNRIDEVECYRAGNWAALGGAASQAGLYNYAGQTTKRTISIGNEWRDTTVELAPVGFHFRRDDAGDEVAKVTVRGGTVRNMQNGYAAHIRGTRDLHISDLDVDRSGPIVFDSNATAFGDIYSSRGTVLRDIECTNASHGTTAAACLQLHAFHDKPLIEGLHAKGGSGSLPCILYEQPVRGAIFRDLLLEDCPGTGFSVTGIDVGTQYESGELGLTLERMTMRTTDDVDPFSTNRYGFHTTLDMAHLTLRDSSIEGMTGNAVNFAGARCFDCLIENNLVTGVQPRFIGTGTEAWAQTVNCDVGHENAYLITTDASGVDDVTFASGTGSSQSEVFCDGAGAWAPMTVSGANQDAMNFGDGLEDSVLRNNVVKDCRNADAFSFTGSVINTAIEGNRVENTGAWGGLTGCVDAFVSDANASNAAVLFRGNSAQGISGQLFAWNAGAEGAYDDLAPGSDVLVAAAPTGACTASVTLRNSAGGAGTTLYVCEGGANPAAK